MITTFRPSSAIRAVLWDLDDTLSNTQGLRAARDAGDRARVKGLLPSIAPAKGLTKVLAAIDGTLPLGVVTVAPRWYAEMLLAHLFPDLAWDVLVPFSKDLREKPNPDLLVKAAGDRP